MRQQIYDFLQKFKYKAYSLDKIKLSLLVNYKNNLPEILKILYWNTEWPESILHLADTLSDEQEEIFIDLLHLIVLGEKVNYISDRENTYWCTNIVLTIKQWYYKYDLPYIKTFDIFNSVSDIGMGFGPDAHGYVLKLNAIPYEDKVYLESDLYNDLSKYCIMLVSDRFDVAIDRDYVEQRELYYRLHPVLKPYAAISLFKVLPVVPVVDEELFIIMVCLSFTRNYYVTVGDVVVSVITNDHSDFNEMFNKFAFLSLYGRGKISIFWVEKYELLYQNSMSRLQYNIEEDYTQQFINRILWK